MKSLCTALLMAGIVTQTGALSAQEVKHLNPVIEKLAVGKPFIGFQTGDLSFQNARTMARAGVVHDTPVDQRAQGRPRRARQAAPVAWRRRARQARRQRLRRHRWRKSISTSPSGSSSHWHRSCRQRVARRSGKVAGGACASALPISASRKVLMSFYAYRISPASSRSGTRSRLFICPQFRSTLPSRRPRGPTLCASLRSL